MIKLIASDLDGTLLTTNKELTPRLKKSLDKAAQNGALFVPATGRTLCAIPQYVKDIPSAKYIITSNGACVYKKGSNTPIFKECLMPEQVEIVYSAASQLDTVIEVFADGIAYIGKRHFEYLQQFGITGRRANYIKTTRTVVPDIYSLLHSNIENIENINVIFNNMSLREEFRADIKNSINAFVTSSSTDNIEVSSSKAAKGNALKNLCQMLGIKNNEVIAFGDSENDIDMLEFAGTGVLMKNADNSLKTQGLIVSSSCDDYGVARILEDIF